MAVKKRKGQMRAGTSTRDFELAVMKAEQMLKRPKGPNETVLLMPSEIRTRPELFQVREFSFGMVQTDPDHVKTLAHNISVQGELDPVTVIKLGTKFVIVEGHHRVAAYKSEKAQWTQSITCRWFPGSVREAIDESMRANVKDRLNVPLPDRMELAWKYTLLDWGSKAEVVKLCNVSDATVAHMRRLKRLAREESKEGAQFRANMGRGNSLMDTSWSQTKLAALGISPEKIDNQERAERLARRMWAKLSDLLSKDPKVTALALELYDPKLPPELVKAWTTAAGVEEAPEVEEVPEAPEVEEGMKAEAATHDAGVQEG